LLSHCITLADRNYLALNALAADRPIEEELENRLLGPTNQQVTSIFLEGSSPLALEEALLPKFEQFIL
jgi:hypothetical protein